MKPKRMSHHYTSELELKSLLIRIINNRKEIGITGNKLNNRINRYVKVHNTLNNLKSKDPEYTKKKNKLKALLKTTVVELSEKCRVNPMSFERFGAIILLMVKRILSKPNFSGYTYKDDIYSDSTYKILKYLNNFNHKMISERTGTTVNAFAYISQIIHNSVLFIINTKKAEQVNIKKQLQMAEVDHNYNVIKIPEMKISENDQVLVETTIELENITSLYKELKKIDTTKAMYTKVIYPSDYQITFDEYDKIKPLLKSKISVQRARIQDEE